MIPVNGVPITIGRLEACADVTVGQTTRLPDVVFAATTVNVWVAVAVV